MNFSLYSLPIEINTELRFIFKINKGRLDWNHGRNGPNSVLGWTATRRRLFYAYGEKWLITIRIINSFLLCFKSNCNLAYAEHISHSSSSFSSSSTLGFKHRIQMQAIFPPAEGSDFLASCASCCVGGLKLPSGPVMWLGLSGLLWTSGHHFPLTHLLFQQKLGPSVPSKWDCSVETALGHFFCSCEVLWLGLLDDAVRRKSLQIALSLPLLWATSYSVVPLSWKFILCHVLLVKQSLFGVYQEGRVWAIRAAALPFLCTSLPLLDGVQAVLCFCILNPVTPQHHESSDHARIYLFFLFFHLNYNSVLHLPG